MAVEMGADHPFVLEPRCPAAEDPAVLDFLCLARALTDAAWVELELRPIGPAPAQTYAFGTRGKGAFEQSLEIGVDFDATLRLGKITELENEIATILTASLKRVLTCRNLMTELTKTLPSAEPMISVVCRSAVVNKLKFLESP